MLEEKNKIHEVGTQAVDKETFDKYRNVGIREFFSEFSVMKNKVTQFVYWVSVDRELATQFLRDEAWFMGIKVRDELKLIDHGPLGSLDEAKTKVGFSVK